MDDILFENTKSLYKWIDDYHRKLLKENLIFDCSTCVIPMRYDVICIVNRCRCSTKVKVR